MSPTRFLVLNLALAFYNVGTIWAHEVDIFRTWRLVDRGSFHRIQAAHWRRLPYWVFGPVALEFVGSTVLIWFHPVASPGWGIWGNLGFQLASLVLTAAFWGRWQAALSKDEAGPHSRYLDHILATHWLRTLLINASGLILLLWTLRSVVVRA